MGLVSAPRPQLIQLDLPAAYPYLHLISEGIATMMRRGESIIGREMLTYALQLAAHEACSMIISRAYLPGEQGRLKVLLSMTQYPLPPCLMIEIQDTGHTLGFDPAGKPASERISEGSWLLDARLLIIHQLASTIEYRPVGCTNRLRMLKLLV